MWLALTLTLVMLFPTQALAANAPNGAITAWDTWNEEYEVSDAYFDNLPVYPDESGEEEYPVQDAASVEQSTSMIPTEGIATPLDYEYPYAIKVDRTNQVITVFSMSSLGHYDVMEKQFICSTGTSKDPTPEGVFTLSASTRRDWQFFKTYNCYVRYPVNIYGDYFFHSVLYKKQDVSTMTKSSYRNLGKKASHGCIRMMVEDCKWLSENCGAGTIVWVTDCERNEEMTKSLLPPAI